MLLYLFHRISDPPVWWPDALIPFDNDVLNRLLYMAELAAPVAVMAWVVYG